MENLKPIPNNTKILFSDLDDNISTGEYLTVKRNSDEVFDDSDTVYFITNGISELEVTRAEITLK